MVFRTRRRALCFWVALCLRALYGWSSCVWFEHVNNEARIYEVTMTEEPYEAYVFSTYYYTVSKSIGNNNVALYFVAPYFWQDKIGNVTVRASTESRSRTSVCKLELSVRWNSPACQMLGMFAGCNGLPNMTKFEISLGNKYHEIPFKKVSYKKRDVVTCVSPIFAAENWHQIIFAAHVYRHFGSFMHLYIRSVVAPVYKLIRVYENEGYIKTQPFPRIRFLSIPEYIYNPNKHVSFRAQEAAQSDCLLQYKESAKWVTFMDLDDILIPRAGPTYLQEFSAIIEDNVYIHYHKQNAYYEASDNPLTFSTFDIFHSARFLNKREAGKIAVMPTYANHTEIHTLEQNRKHRACYPEDVENVIVHLKQPHPLNASGERKHLWPYFFRNDTTIFNRTDASAIQYDYKRFSSKYSDVWKRLPSVSTYFPIISNCYNKQYYRHWYTEPEKVTYCVNPDLCEIPPELVAPCVNADGDFFSSEKGTIINVHYTKTLRFVLEEQLVQVWRKSEVDFRTHPMNPFNAYKDYFLIPLKYI